MPKAILEFNLPEEREDFDIAVNANKVMYELDELRELLRRKSKYEDQETVTIDELRTWLYNVSKGESYGL